MGYLGNKPADSYLTLEKQTFTTSATDTYTLDREVSSVNDIELFLNNVRQEPTEAYTISGTTLTLASAITASDSMYCIYQGRAVGTQSPAIGSVTNDMLAGSIANAKLANSSITLNGTAVSLGGSASTGFDSQLFHVRDEKANNTNGGSCTGGTWNTRDLNTILTNEISGASLSSNQITLPSGTYFIISYAPAYACSRHKLKLRNITDSSDTLIGNSEYTIGQAQTISFINGRFTIASSKTFEIQHYPQNTVATNGFGVTTIASVVEVYTNVQIWKVA